MPGTPLPDAEQIAGSYTPHEHEELHQEVRRWRERDRPAGVVGKVGSAQPRTSSIFADRREDPSGHTPS